MYDTVKHIVKVLHIYFSIKKTNLIFLYVLYSVKLYYIILYYYIVSDIFYII